MSVVFPAPFGPMRPTSSPCLTFSVTSDRAWTPPKRTDRPSTARTSGLPDRSGRSVRGVIRSLLAASTSGACTCTFLWSLR